ncbi:unnamed protein product [Dracunculus medinensis]|uniref:Glyco_trans_2-like domain-containing protein n=1 Tax=Dracunculus medinensis TaxID=318479 RepID=A0A3P7Q7D5_DRAME|nr:unnamed protein product [Dracunculus medinensis]
MSIVSKGAGYSKNQAVIQSDGAFLCFCDADDVSNKERLFHSYAAILEVKDPEMTLFGTNFFRDPAKSTFRYADWANSITGNRLYHQIFTSHGPTLVAPTWFFSRKLYDLVGGFCERYGSGFPEDLEFFYNALRIGCKLHKVEKTLVLYRYHPACASLNVSKEMIWKMRLSQFQELVLSNWKSFTIWNAGKQGKHFFNSLTKENQKKVVAFCDVDAKKIYRGCYEHFDAELRSVTAVIPIIPIWYIIFFFSLDLHRDVVVLTRYLC